MLFNDISGFLTTRDLNMIVLPEAKNKPFRISIMLNAKSIFSDLMYAGANGLSLYGLGDIIAAHINSVAEQFTIHAASDSQNFEASATAIPSRIATFDQEKDFFNARFLSWSHAASVPPYVPFSLSVAGAPINLPILEGSNGTNYTGRKSGNAVVFDCYTPKEQGYYTFSCANRQYSLFVSNFRHHNVIKFRNAFNAEEYIYLDSEIKLVNTRNSSTAKVGGAAVEYDINTERSFEFSAKALLESQIKQVEGLAFASNISINSVDVVISELKITRSKSSADLFEISFSGIISTDNIPLRQAIQRIFTSPFSSQFS